MRYLLAFALFLLPVSALAAPLPAPIFSSQKDLFVATSSPGNAYFAGGTVNVAAPTAGDLTAVAGSLELDAPVAGDSLLIGGIENVRGAITGDLRALAGRVVVAAPVSGDEVVVAGSFNDTVGSARDYFIIAGETTFTNGATGPVTIYANNVSLAGNFASDVHVVASGRVALAPGTHIKGALDYEAPASASIPDSVVATGGIHYSGASYLPTRQARALELASVGVFLLVKVLGALILAGLVAGLFPMLTEAVATEAFDTNARRLSLTILLGFAILVATPLLLILLAITFVGLGLAFILGLLYLLLASLAFIYAGIILGAWLARKFFKRESILWHDAVLGMLLLSLFTLVPIAGILLLALLLLFALGALARISYRFAFPRDSETSRLL